MTARTTVPAASTSTPATLPRCLAVEWLLPEPGRPPLALTEPRLTLGRDEDCDVVLGGDEASRRHAELVCDGPLCVLRDLGSTNGTHLNGQRVTEAPLAPGNVIRVGAALGVVVAWSEQDADVGASFGELAPGLCGGRRLAAAVREAELAAATDLPVIVQGETGTGKECVARAIHAWSRRRGDFVALNCAALPESLAEAELFGYRKGAFTGADRASPGLFRAAHEGTLLLDEVIDLPLELQSKLLRVLEQSEVVPLGESRPVPVDVRMVVAAQEPLAAAVSQKRFRADLYARLNGLEVLLPPLRERVEDVGGLLLHFLNDLSGGQAPRVGAKLLERLCLHDFPFNVRELQLLARRLLVLHGHEPELRRSHLPPALKNDAGTRRRSESEKGPAPVVEPADRDEHDLTRLAEALREHGGHVTRAAAAAGISRQRAYRLMRGLQRIDLDEMRRGQPVASGNGRPE